MQLYRLDPFINYCFSVKRKHMRRTQAPNATSNGGRVPRRALRQRLTDKRVISAVCEPLFGV